MPAGALKRLGGALKPGRPATLGGGATATQALTFDEAGIARRPATFTARAERDPIPELEFPGVVTQLPGYTAIVGHPAAGTASMLALVGAALVLETHGARTVLLDPRGSTITEVAKLADPRLIDILEGEDATIPAAVRAMRNGVTDSTLLIDNAGRPEDPDTPELARYIGELAARDHRLVIRAERPEDLPSQPVPQVVCLFALQPGVAMEWERWCPQLAPVFVWHLRDGERLRGHGQIRGIEDDRIHGTIQLPRLKPTPTPRTHAPPGPDTQDQGPVTR